MMAKYYAVKVGQKPGVYETWSECEAQVKGFKGAIYKSFNSFDEAQNFIAPQDNLTEEDKETVKWELNGIYEGLKERDIAFIVEKVRTIAKVLNIDLDPVTLDDFRKE